MDTTSLPVLAGIASTVIFASSMVPMLVKAGRTRDVASYSLSNLLLANVGNTIHSVYVFSLPPGPIWALHGFYLVSTALMLIWFFRYGVFGSHRLPGDRIATISDSSRLAAPGHATDHPRSHRLPRASCSRSIASNSALKLPLPKPSEPCRSMNS